MVELGPIYVDSSLVISRAFRQPGAIEGVDLSSAISSEVTIAETGRALQRLRLNPAVSEEALSEAQDAADRNTAGLSLIPVDRIVLKRAGGPFPTPLKILDAIHLATALLWYEHAGDITFLTHDRQLATAARACGLKVCPPPV
jgi:predicted nucleic acid-binding protein